MKIKELDEILATTLRQLLDSKIGHEKASQINSTIGRQFQSASLKIKYAKARNEKPNIESLNP